MLAGAGGVDLALLVVAADEGPMPQTREHLAILDLLDVPAGIVVITKCDLAEPGYVDLVEAELDDTLKGSTLAGAPIVRVSATARQGLDELLAAIEVALDHTPPKRDLGKPRLPIDRAFTIQGFGAVVTGTLVDGALEVGQEVELQPGRLKARIRGLQRHRTKVSRLEPGTRAAVNLSGIRAEDISRGMVLARPGSLDLARVVDVRLRGTRILAHPVAHNAGITFLSATTESEGRLRLLDRDQLGPAEEAWAQVVIESPVPVSVGDHCVIRTPNETAAGGRIVAVNPKRHRRHHNPTLDALALRLEGSLGERLVDVLLTGPKDARALAAALGADAGEVEESLGVAVTEGLVAGHGALLFARGWLDSQAGRVVAAAADYLEAHELRPEAPREHVRSVAGLPQALFDVVVQEALVTGRVEAPSSSGLVPGGYELRLTPAQEAEANGFLQQLAQGRYSPPTEHMPGPALLAVLEARGQIATCAAGIAWEAGVYREMIERVSRHVTEHGQVTLAEVRDLFGTSRKYAQAFLEDLDAKHITRRVGDARLLR
jgi:selenocysteine-specific elongation factor